VRRLHLQPLADERLERLRDAGQRVSLGHGASVALRHNTPVGGLAAPPFGATLWRR
jgi:hypothetical protein